MQTRTVYTVRNRPCNINNFSPNIVIVRYIDQLATDPFYTFETFTLKDFIRLSGAVLPIAL